MEVVVVRGVVLGAEDDAPDRARAVVHRAQEAAARVGGAARPVAGDAHGPAVGEDEAGDVDRVRARVLAAPLDALGAAAAADVAAGVAAEVLDGGDALAEARD